MTDTPQTPIARSAPAIGSDEIDLINYVNIGLMIFALLLAAYMPFEVFIIAYAVLGPLHYLTEISWLHDRRYFSVGRYDWCVLALPLIPLGMGFIVDIPWRSQIDLMLVAGSFTAAAGLAFCKDWRKKIALVVIGCGVGYLGRRYGIIATFFLALLPTVIHVYVFTGLFIVYGALKGRSTSGILSALVYLASPLLCVYVFTTPDSYHASQYALEASKPFHGLCRYLNRVFGVSLGYGDIQVAMRFLAFAYTYHYLNWFSKTRVINWHEMSQARLCCILVLYMMAVGAYAISYEVGFAALLALSAGHVYLEFPLNFRSMVGIFSELIHLGGLGSASPRKK